MFIQVLVPPIHMSAEKFTLARVLCWLGMIFDYIMNPIICVIWISKAAINLIPEIPFGVYAIAFTCLFTAMNLRGIESSSRTNTIIAAGLGVVIILFLGAAIRYLFLNPPANAGEWTRPFL